MYMYLLKQIYKKYIFSNSIIICWLNLMNWILDSQMLWHSSYDHIILIIMLHRVLSTRIIMICTATTLSNTAIIWRDTLIIHQEFASLRSKLILTLIIVSILWRTLSKSTKWRDGYLNVTNCMKVCMRIWPNQYGVICFAVGKRSLSH